MVSRAASKREKGKTDIGIFEEHGSRQQRSCGKKDNRIETKNGARR